MRIVLAIVLRLVVVAVLWMDRDASSDPFAAVTAAARSDPPDVARPAATPAPPARTDGPSRTSPRLDVREQARALVEKGDFQGAYDLLTRAIAARPGDADIYNERGLVVLDERDYTGARRDFTEAVSIQPRHAAAWSNRSVTRRRLDDPQGALSDASRAIQLDPRFADAYSNRGLVLMELGRIDEARRDFQQALALVPGHPRFRINLGKVEVVARRWQEAEAILSSIDQSSPLALSGRPPRAIARVYLGRRADAEADCRALGASPIYEAFCLGVVHEHLGEMDRAREHIDRARTLASAPALFDIVEREFRVIGARRP